MKATVMILISIFVGRMSFAQFNETGHTDQFVDLAATVGKSQGTGAISYVYNWQLGKKHKAEAGLGMRLTSALGKNPNHITAGPARLTRSFTAPFLIFFAGQKTENWDTLKLYHPFVNALNVTINLGYRLTPRLSTGFNIDLIGVSFGRKSSASFLSNGQTKTEPQSRPTAFNLLLTGDHDRGSLNSEFFLKYRLNDRWAVRAIYQFLFTEYKTSSLRQTTSDGTTIDRFRNKANNFGIAVSSTL